MKAQKETRTQYVRRIWKEAIEECSKVRIGSCGSCGGPTTNFPFTENGMLRQIVICKCCSTPKCPGHAAIAKAKGGA